MSKKGRVNQSLPMCERIRVRQLRIGKQPLIVMDQSVSTAENMHLDEKAAFACCESLVAQTRKHTGECVVVRHNGSPEHFPMSSRPDSENYHPRLYGSLLELLATVMTRWPSANPRSRRAHGVPSLRTGRSLLPDVDDAVVGLCPAHGRL